MWVPGLVAIRSASSSGSVVLLSDRERGRSCDLRATASPVLARARALLLAHRPQDALTELAMLPAADAIGAEAAALRGTLPC